jgi:thioredoxin-like negative regulator of GroEL
MRESWNAAEAGDVERAAAFAERALELDPDDPLLLYNLACYRALGGRNEEALELLARSLPRDESLRENARTDPDLESLRETEAYRRLVG